VADPLTAAPAKAKPGAGKKILGLPRNVALGGGLAVVAGIAFFLYRARKDKAAAASSAASGGAETASGTAGTACTDPYGNPGTLDANGTCETVDESGSISALQTEIGSLETAQSASTGTTGTTSTGTTTGTGTATTPPAAAPAAPFMANGLHTLSVTSTSAVAAWNGVQGATSYKIHLQRGTTFVGDYNTTSPTASYTFHGLKPRTSYNWKVAAVKPGTAGAWSNETSTFTTS
jgi:hypothetical protein